MKKTNIIIIASIIVAAVFYFTYSHFVKQECDKSCEKDSTSVIADSASVKSDSLPEVKDSVKAEVDTLKK